MEDSFDTLITQINQKIAEAGNLLKEASDLGKKTGLPCLGGDSDTIEWLACNKSFNISKNERHRAVNELEAKLAKINFAPIFDPLNDMGWRTSSMEHSC